MSTPLLDRNSVAHDDAAAQPRRESLVTAARAAAALALAGSLEPAGCAVRGLVERK